MEPKYLVTTLTVLLAVLFQTGPIYLPLVWIREPINAGGIVSICDEANLRAMLAGGGRVTFSCSGTITLTDTIIITTETIIDGTGQNVTISGNNAVRVFWVYQGITTNLNRLTVANGNFTSVFTSNVGGGGIYSDAGIVTVSNSTFSENSTHGGNGGAIFNRNGTVIVSNSTFAGNTAYTGYWGGVGGAIYIAGGSGNSSGTVTVSNSTFSGNIAYGGAGGIKNEWRGMLTVSSSTFSDNIYLDNVKLDKCSIETPLS
jgi:hypothetical protein